ncbi:Uncharacterized protein APZ42_015326 [Daphnia magna]|uniref:Uncharacterized protein n=1 Tax=Daphnia magna TaxID=35525 RepID=A0A162PDG4_9CRUS|nr:Uncharacterized protein APZ42_015326 [Daphnia magna]
MCQMRLAGYSKYLHWTATLFYYTWNYYACGYKDLYGGLCWTYRVIVEIVHSESLRTLTIKL